MTDHIRSAIDALIKIWPDGVYCEHEVAREVFKSLKNAAIEGYVTKDRISALEQRIEVYDAENKDLHARLAKLLAISVDIGGIGGSQDSPDPIKAVAIIAELKDKLVAANAMVKGCAPKVHYLLDHETHAGAVDFLRGLDAFLKAAE